LTFEWGVSPNGPARLDQNAGMGSHRLLSLVAGIVLDSHKNRSISVALPFNAVQKVVRNVGS
jgi:hypothetical protein